MAPGRIAPRELHARRAAGERIELLDVREHDELAICRIEGARHVPLGELPRRAEELDRDAEWVCVCHHGVRSARAAAFLEHLGFANVLNLTGGIDRWADEVDPAMPRY